MHGGKVEAGITAGSCRALGAGPQAESRGQTQALSLPAVRATAGKPDDRQIT